MERALVLSIAQEVRSLIDQADGVTDYPDPVISKTVGQYADLSNRLQTQSVDLLNDLMMALDGSDENGIQSVATRALPLARLSLAYARTERAVANLKESPAGQLDYELGSIRQRTHAALAAMTSLFNRIDVDAIRFDDKAASTATPYSSCMLALSQEALEWSKAALAVKDARIASNAANHAKDNLRTTLHWPAQQQGSRVGDAEAQRLHEEQQRIGGQ